MTTYRSPPLKQDPNTRGCDEEPLPEVGDIRLDWDGFVVLVGVGMVRLSGQDVRISEWKRLEES